MLLVSHVFLLLNRQVVTESMWIFQTIISLRVDWLIIARNEIDNYEQYFVVNKSWTQDNEN